MVSLVAHLIWQAAHLQVNSATNLFKAVDTEREPLLHMMPRGSMKPMLAVLLRLFDETDQKIATLAAFTLG